MTYLIKILDKQIGLLNRRPDSILIWAMVKLLRTFVFSKVFRKNILNVGRPQHYFWYKTVTCPVQVLEILTCRYLTYTSLYTNLLFKLFLQKKRATIFCFPCKTLFSFKPSLQNSSLRQQKYYISGEIAFTNYAMNDSNVLWKLTQVNAWNICN